MPYLTCIPNELSYFKNVYDIYNIKNIVILNKNFSFGAWLHLVTWHLLHFSQLHSSNIKKKKQNSFLTPTPQHYSASYCHIFITSFFYLHIHHFVSTAINRNCLSRCRRCRIICYLVNARTRWLYGVSICALQLQLVQWA